MSWISYDEKVARDAYDQLNITGITENAVFPKEKEKENYRPRSLVDETLEYIDPTPNIYTLFVQFNEKFFWNVLLPVQVKWSPRMTSCAGVCSFHPRNRECVISLSTPLLKLRPRKDLIETLLHEMIHAYLFLTNNNRDRDGHGPVFQSHMKRINKQAGTNITIYHSFHEEVRLYQQHWWRCNGPCQKRAPYFGTVRRAMNRAPGPSDFWWKEHLMTCGGQFIKVKEPEKPVKMKNKGDAKGRTSTSTITKPSENNSLINWMIKTDNNKDKGIFNKLNQPQKANGNDIKKPNSQPQGSERSNTKSNSTSKFQTDLTKLGNSTNNVHGWGTGGPNAGSNKPSPKPQVKGWNNTKSSSVSNVQTDMKKLGNSTNNVHGWGTGGPDGSSSSSSSSSNSGSRSSTNNTNSSLSFSGTLGGVGTGRSILLDKFSNTSTTNNSHKNNSTNRSSSMKTSPLSKFTNSTNSNYNVETATVKTVLCPICNKAVDESKINAHLDTCLESPQEPEVIHDSSHKKRKSEDHYSTSNKKLKDENQTTSATIDCPLCSKKLLPDDFNDHLQKCLSGDMAEEEDVVSLHDSSSSSINLHDSPYYCLICDKKLEPGMSLNEHLEECVASVFNDSNDNDIEEKDNTGDKSIKTEKEVLEQYPCPICMSLIEESLMNDHVDMCLTKSK